MRGKSQRKAGHVYLVGAGPGPADLLTWRARRLVRAADVLAYDDLVHPSLLELASPHCELLAIGYRAGQQHDRPPPLHPEVEARAAAGLKVVRLKSGDPLIFGRGGEEAEALIAAEIPFTIVPGITAVLAAAASCRLPLTWRGLSSELRIVTQSMRPPREGKPAAGATWALYMPRHAVANFAQRLMEEGQSPDLPAAFVIAASLPQERCIQSTLGALAAAVSAHPSDLPGLVMIGASLGPLAAKPGPAFARPKPLQGCRILIARSQAESSRMGAQLRARGADTWDAPWIQSVSCLEKVEDLAHKIQESDWLLVTSPSAWRGLLEQLGSTRLDLRALARLKLISVGSAAKALARQHLRTDYQISHLRQLLTEWPASCHGAGLLVSTDEEGPATKFKLDTLNIPASLQVTARLIYRYPKLPQPQPDFIVLPHLRALNLLFQDESYRDSLKDATCIAYGPSIAAAARAYGVRDVHELPQPETAEAVELLQELWETRAMERTWNGSDWSSHSLYGAGQG